MRRDPRAGDLALAVAVLLPLVVALPRLGWPANDARRLAGMGWPCHGDPGPRHDAAGGSDQHPGAGVGPSLRGLARLWRLHHALGFVAFLSSVLTLVSINALSSPEAAVPGDPETITREQLARHDSAESCWKTIHGTVYDVTGFIADHPTPAAVILEWCGRDAWDNKRPGRPHSSFAEGMLERFRIGRLVD